MSKTYRIEELITIVDERNSDNKDLPLLGINLSKSFFPSVANVIGTDLSRYKVIRKGCFACNMMHVGRDMKVPIALYLDDNEAIISPAYPMFTVSDENIILPEFLMLFFKNSEFDREAGFYASAGIRGGFDWEDFSNITLPVPPISEQRRIVSEYQTVERRIKNNEAMIKKLEETAQAIYHHTFVEGIDENNLPEGWKNGFLCDICEFSNGKQKEPSCGEIPIYGGNGIVGYCEEHNASNIVVIGRVGVNCGCLYLEEDNCWVNDNAMKGISLNGSLLFAFYHMNALQINRYSGGSSQPLVTQTLLNQIPCIVPCEKTIKEFDTKIKVIRNQIKLIFRETSHLRTLLSLLTSKIS